MTRIATLTKRESDNVNQTLRQLVESGQIFRYTKSELATELNVTTGLINRRLDDIYKGIEPDTVVVIRSRMQLMFDRLFRELADMLDKEERGREKRDTIKLMLECIDKFTVFLEDFGVKEKAVQTINIGVEKQLVLIKDSKVIDAEIVKKVEEHIVEGELVGEEDEQRNA